MEFHKICVVGGTGFVGRHLVAELTRRRYLIRVLTRRRSRHRELLVLPTLELVEANVHSVADLSTHFKGFDAVVNLAGILNERTGRAGEDFQSVHVELPRKTVEACAATGVKRLLHMSALNASSGAPSRYLRTKAEGERTVHEAGDGLRVTSFKPSIIFGQDDSFFNRFALFLRFTPYFFPLACPDARFSPVSVKDVVEAFVRALADKRTFGRSHELCGPETFTLRALVEYTARHAGLRRKVLGLNDRFSRLQARFFELAPGKPFSVDNYLSMQVDSVCRENGFEALGITPRGIDGEVPRYLAHRGRAAVYDELRRAHRP